MFDRATVHCFDKTTLTLERSYLSNMFRNYGYPLSSIKRSMRYKMPREKGRGRTKSASDEQRTSQENELRFLPYVNGIYETLTRHLRSHNIEVAHSHPHSYPKGGIPQDAKAGVIYEFPCIQNLIPDILEKLVNQGSTTQSYGPTSQYYNARAPATNAHLMKRKSLDWPQARQADFYSKPFILMKTRQTEILHLIHSIPLSNIAKTL